MTAVPTPPPPPLVRSLLGRSVAVDCCDGASVQGRLVNATRASLWLIVDEADRFIRLDDVAAVRPAG